MIAVRIEEAYRLAPAAFRLIFGRRRYPLTMPTLKSRLGDWELDHLHVWSDREERIRAESVRLIDGSTKVATIGSCFAQELAKVMGTVDISGGMHPGGLFYSTATIRQELERIAGGWPERAADPPWRIEDGFVDPFRDYDTRYPDEAALLAARAEADALADALRHIDDIARREAFTYAGWTGFASNRVMTFLNEQPARQPP